MQQRNWFAGIAAVIVAVPVALAGGWLTWTLGNAIVRAVGGKAGESLAAAVGVVGMVATIVAVVAVAVWPRRLPWFARGTAGTTRTYEAKLKGDLAALGRDPVLARWLPLATRLHTAYPVLVRSWERRYQQLLADPRRRHWAERALAGEQPTDAEIDYLDDPDLLLTCPHLRAIEAHLRRADPGMKPVYGLVRSVRCARPLEGAALLARFEAAPCVEWNEPDPHPRDPEPGNLRCRQCQSSIFGVY